MALPFEELGRRFASLGIGDSTRVVLYSRKATQWATRVWWMLRAIGFDNAAILDGGFDKWAAEGRPVSSTPHAYDAAMLMARPRPRLFVGKAEMLSAIGDPAVCSINALAPDLHSGANDRYGRPGRIPGSVNVPAAGLQDPATFALRPASDVADVFSRPAPTNRSASCFTAGAASQPPWTLSCFINSDTRIWPCTTPR